MSSPKNFDNLKAKWYKKLANSGFADIEREDGTLKRWDSTAFYDRYDATTAAMKTEYYRLAGQFLHEYEFVSALDKEIWRLHAEGVTYPNISKSIKRFAKNHGTGRDAVNRVVIRLRTIMYKLYDVKL